MNQYCLECWQFWSGASLQRPLPSLFKWVKKADDNDNVRGTQITSSRDPAMEMLREMFIKFSPMHQYRVKPLLPSI